MGMELNGNNCEEGEILEEGEEIEVDKNESNIAVSELNNLVVEKQVEIVEKKPKNEVINNGNVHNTKKNFDGMKNVSNSTSQIDGNPKKRLFSQMHGQNTENLDAASIHSKLSRTMKMKQEYQSRGNKSRENSTTTGYSNAKYESLSYSEDFILKFPRQEPESRVLLKFEKWMADPGVSYLRLDILRLQEMILNVLKYEENEKERHISPFLSTPLCPGVPQPTKVCLVLLGGCHPPVLQKYRSLLSYFNGSTSIPCRIAKDDGERRLDPLLPELVYNFAKPPVDFTSLSINELYYSHELVFFMTYTTIRKHTSSKFSYNDELIFQPTGTFTRKSQPIGGTWVLDGDLLHLKWINTKNQSQITSTSEAKADMPEAENEEYALDVLISMDPSMHQFATDETTDKTYSHETPGYHTNARNQGATRMINLSLLKAIALNIPNENEDISIIEKNIDTQTTPVMNSTESNISVPLENINISDFDEFILSYDELLQHGFPVDVAEEQERLADSTDDCAADEYVKTEPVHSNSESGSLIDKKKDIYAIDCEMCETDLGHELTRVTVADSTCTVVYDQLVKPQSTILNYHTEYSGITKEMLENVSHTVSDVQKDLLSKFLSQDTILVGHSLTSDLRALRLVHLKIADTSILYPHERGFPFRQSLKHLSNIYLGKSIQNQGDEGHDSAEDAITAMELLLLKVKHGTTYGVPDVLPYSTRHAYDSLPLKVVECGKHMAMWRLEVIDDEKLKEEMKPWKAYVSGDARERAQSPFIHGKSDSNLKLSRECKTWEELVGGLKSNSNDQFSLFWLELNRVVFSTHKETNSFLNHHDEWMEAQFEYAKKINAYLEELTSTVLPKGTLVIAIPQANLSMLRYLKGQRIRSKWNDAEASGYLWTDEMQAATTDLVRGILDSCFFLKQIY